MSIFGLIEKRSSLANPDRWMLNLLGGRSTAAGLLVSEQNALTYTAVYACVQVIAEALGSLPMNLYRETSDGQEVANDLPQSDFFNHAPNDETGSLSFKSTEMGWVLTWGNGYSEIEFNKAGEAIALHQVAPNRIIPRRRPGDWRIEYYVTRVATITPYMLEQPLPNNTDGIIDRDDMFHIAGLGFDGIMGYSPIAMAREAIGLGLGSEAYGSRYFGNSGVPSGVLTSKTKINDPDKLRKQWNEAVSGPNQRGTAVLEFGTEWKQIGIPPEDSQFLETRKYQRSEIASIYRVPPHKIGDLERSTNNNIEQQALEFITHCLFPWAMRWAQEADRKLLTVKQRKAGYFFGWDFDDLLVGDMKTRYEAYAIARQWGWMNPDDILRREHKKCLPNGQGKTYLIPTNMHPADRAGDVVDSQIEKNKRKAGKAGKAPELPPADLTEPAAGPDLAKVRSHARALLVEAAGRAVRKEVAVIRRAARKPAEFRAIVTEFYTEHPDTLRGILIETTAAFADLLGKPFSAARSAVGAVASGIDKEAAALVTVADVEPRMLAWEKTRAEKIADDVLAALGV